MIAMLISIQLLPQHTRPGQYGKASVVQLQERFSYSQASPGGHKQLWNGSDDELHARAGCTLAVRLAARLVSMGFWISVAILV